MLRAEQQALIQEANQQLLQIRELELNYFTNVFENFGIISGLISGFTLSALTQVDAMGASANAGFKWLFWLTCAAVMCTSLHCLLTTTFVNVFGTGLALRGPSGSMVRAVDGMIKEKDAIFASLIISVLLFQLETLAAGFLVMDQNAAIACSMILGIGTYYWYKYCTRIYHRFKIHKVQFAWKDSEDGPSTDAADIRMPTESANLNDDAASSSSADNILNAKAKPQRKTSVLQKFMGKGTTKAPSNLMVPLTTELRSEMSLNRMDGYLTVKESSNNWVRQFFVIQGSEMYYYHKKEDYLLNPAHSIKNRPITLKGYELTSEVKNNGSYEIALTPEDDDDERKSWFFRCDTAEELQAWGESFTRGIRLG